MADFVEKGEIFFFYRPKIDADRVNSLDDVQRLHMVLVPEGSEPARLILVGKKRLPEIVKGKPKSTAREWMMIDMTGRPQAIGEALAPLVYETKTRGEQEQGEAIPAGEGRYAVFERNGSSRLAYRLTRPKKPGRAQQELRIASEASYVISVRNPAVDVPGFPDARPEYPQRLGKKFADKRWIDVDDSQLLDYENAQLLLIGAHDDLSEEDIDISGKANLFGRLGLKRNEWPTEALESGKFAEPELRAEAKAPEGDRSKGGERGGKATRHTASAAGVARALKGVTFPCSKAELVKQAQGNQASGEIVKVLKEIPERNFGAMADVQKAVGKVR